MNARDQKLTDLGIKVKKKKGTKVLVGRSLVAKQKQQS